MARKTPHKGYFVKVEIEFLNRFDESFSITPVSDRVKREYAKAYSCKPESVKWEVCNCYDISEYESDTCLTKAEIEDLRHGWSVRKLIARSVFSDRFEQYYESETVYCGRKL